MLGSPGVPWVNSIACYIVGGSESTWPLLRGDTHMVSILRGIGGKVKMRCYRTYEGGRLASVLDVQPFFIKENWIYTMTRHHANNILLARSLPFDYDIRWWSHPLMIPLHCIVRGPAKSNNRTSGQFEFDVTLFFCLFLFDFVHSHAQCDCRCSIVCLRFQVIQINYHYCFYSFHESGLLSHI